MLSKHIQMLGGYLVELKRKRYDTEKALLEEYPGLVQEIKERA